MAQPPCCLQPTLLARVLQVSSSHAAELIELLAGANLWQTHIHKVGVVLQQKCCLLIVVCSEAPVTAWPDIQCEIRRGFDFLIVQIKRLFRA